MEVLTNETLVQKRARLGKIASLAGMAILAAGLIASFNPSLLYASMGALILGFLVSQVGSHNLQRWARKPRADQVLQTSLKGIDRKFRLYNYYLPSAHVLMGPTGIFVFVIKSHSGEITCAGNRCRQKLTAGRVLLFFGQESLGNPMADLDIERRKLANFLHEQLPELDQIPIHGAVVFADPRVNLTLIEPSMPIMTPKQLKAYVRRPAKEERYLSGEERRQIVELFDGTVQQMTSGA